MSDHIPNPDRSTRSEKIAQLRAFQQSDLDSLRQSLASLDTRIKSAEAAVLHATNLASAARGLVGQRGGVPPPPPPTNSRSRPKQRLWSRKDGTHVRHDANELPSNPDIQIPICGVVYSPFRKRFEAPRQSFTGGTGKAVVWMTNGMEVLNNVQKGDRMWILYWLDRNDGLWRHFVRPPRAKGGWRVGVFASRSPNRPSPIGLTLSIVEAVNAEQGKLDVSGADVLDETPLLGLRKYESGEEAWPKARAGWIDEMEKLRPLHYDELDGYTDVGSFEVFVDDMAKERLTFIDERSAIDVGEMIQKSLKRIHLDELVNESNADGMNHVVTGSLPVGAFRVLYEARPETGTIIVRQVTSGMRSEVCEREAATDPEARLHLDFQGLFPNEPQ